MAENDKSELKPEVKKPGNDEANGSNADLVTPKTSETPESADSDVDIDMTNEDDDTKDDAPVTAAVDPEIKPAGKFKRLIRAYWKKKKWTLPLSVLAAIAILLGVPFTRYTVLGLAIHEPVTVKVVDSITSRPVSGASLTLAGKTLKTDAVGKVTGNVRLGNAKLEVTKQYYKTTSQSETVTMSKTHNSFTVKLTATGRQVPVKVVDKVTGKGIANAEIIVLSTESKTDKNGEAIVVLPTTGATQKATVKLAGYNSLSSTIQVTDQTVVANTFSLTPSGKLYFLSNKTGKIDVVKTNLDGSDRQTVLAGTGSEDPNNTSLLASRDWKYLALLSKRSGDTASVYLIDTTNADRVTTIDEGNASFSFVGWSDDSFVYQVNRYNVQSWQPKAQSLKSYDAANSKLYNLDDTSGEGSDAYNYAYTNFSSVYLLGDQVVYLQNWYGSYYNSTLNGRNVNVTTVRSDGSGKKTVKSFPIPDGNTYYYVGLVPYEPEGLYIQLPGANGAASQYFAYDDGAVTSDSSVTDASYGKPYPTYLVSPSNKATFWSDSRDGKNVLFVGDDDAKNQKQIAESSDYAPYGWYSDKYVLVSKNSSELYIMPAEGSGNPVKITDYYKPPIDYRGYGGGYGGL